MSSANQPPANDNDHHHPSPNTSSERNNNNRKKHVKSNDLLRFTLPPRQRPLPFSGKRSTAKHSNFIPFNKKRFVHSNFRFVVSDRYPHLHTHVLDPDALVAWEYVEQVVLHSTAEVNCPICMSQPVSPQISQCGHIFCHSCILHYFAMGEKPFSWRSCPICHENFHSRELRSALLFKAVDYTRHASKSIEEKFLAEAYQQEKPRDYIIMRLMQRSTGSNVILPRYIHSSWADTQLPILKSSNKNILEFAKLAVASPLYIVENIVTPEIASLKVAMDDAQALGDVEDIAWIKMALDKCLERLNKLNVEVEKGTLSSSPHMIPPSPEFPLVRLANPDSGSLLLLPPPMVCPDPFTDLSSENNVKYDSNSDLDNSDSRGTSSEDVSPALAPSNSLPVTTSSVPITISSNISNVKNSFASLNDGMYYHFYQSIDGQHYYLHPLEIKILKSEYGSYDMFPDEICVKINTITESTLTEDTRKRYKYLSHLPLGCDVNFVEVDWHAQNTCLKRGNPAAITSMSVSPTDFMSINNDRLIKETSIAPWKDELSTRRKRHVKKEKKEELEARRRKDSSGNLDHSSFSELSGTSRSQRPPQPQEVFDFDDWVPLGSGKEDPNRKSPVSPAPFIQHTQPELPLSYAAKAQGHIFIPNVQTVEKRSGKKKKIVLMSTSGHQNRG